MSFKRLLFSEWYEPKNIASLSSVIVPVNRPFYSCVPSDLAFEWKRVWRWACFDTNPPAFHM